MIYDCIVIGAGAAGLFYGAVLPKKINGLLLEKTSRIGTKLLMSGSGQCNITHDGSIKDFVSCYGNNGKKIRGCLYQYHNAALRDFLSANHVETFVREDGKVFPKSMDAKEIRDMLLAKCKNNGFTVETECPVIGLARTDSLWAVQTEKDTFHAATVILATGGCSYPTTGSDGSIFPVLTEDLRIEVVTPKPALSPIKVKEYPFSELSGISFSEVETAIFHDNKKMISHTGGLLFTHSDFSGPAVMNISKYGNPGDTLTINFVYPLHFDAALSAVKSALSSTKESPANVLSKTFHLPKRFAKVLADTAGASPKELAKALTGSSYQITSIGSFKHAMATAGGIALQEINTKTMELKKHPGLFAIGEILDVDGITGGYNLQFAFSSACSAARKCADNY